jgi:hypothetical protein
MPSLGLLTLLTELNRLASSLMASIFIGMRALGSTCDLSSPILFSTFSISYINHPLRIIPQEVYCVKPCLSPLPLPFIGLTQQSSANNLLPAFGIVELLPSGIHRHQEYGLLIQGLLIQVARSRRLRLLRLRF